MREADLIGCDLNRAEVYRREDGLKVGQRFDSRDGEVIAVGVDEGPYRDIENALRLAAERL